LPRYFCKHKENKAKTKICIATSFGYVQAELFQFHISPDIANLTDGNIICISLEFRALSCLSRHVSPCMCITRVFAIRKPWPAVRKLRGLGASL